MLPNLGNIVVEISYHRVETGDMPTQRRFRIETLNGHQWWIGSRELYNLDNLKLLVRQVRLSRLDAS